MLLAGVGVKQGGEVAKRHARAAKGADGRILFERCTASFAQARGGGAVGADYAQRIEALQQKEQRLGVERHIAPFGFFIGGKQCRIHAGAVAVSEAFKRFLDGIARVAAQRAFAYGQHDAGAFTVKVIREQVAQFVR